MAELQKLGIHVAKSTVEKYRPRRDRPPSPTWTTFLDQHVKDLVSIDFFIVPSATLRVLFVFVVLAHDRRRIVHFNVTEHPTAQWTAQQLVEAFPFDSAPRYLLRDGDGIYGERVLPFEHTSEGSKTWASRRSSRRRPRPGKTPMLNGLSAAFAENCSTTSSSLTNGISSDFYRLVWNITIGGEPIGHWTGTRRTVGRCDQLNRTV